MAREFKDTTLPSIAIRGLGILDAHVVSSCSSPSGWRFRGGNVPQSRQGRPRTQATAQGKQLRRPAHLGRRTDPTEMKIPPWQGREVDLQTLYLCKREYRD